MRRLILLFLVLLPLFLLLNMPASQLFRILPVPEGLTIEGLDGRLVSGRIERIDYKGLSVENIRYSLQLRCLLWLELCYRIVDDNDALWLNPAYSPWRGISLDDSRIELPIDRLRPWMKELLVKPRGRLQLDIETLQLDGSGRLKELQAVVFWRKAGIEGETVELGDFRADIQRQPKGLGIRLADLPGAQLGVSGEIELEANRYRVELQLEARPGLGESAVNALQLLARKNGLNRYLFQRQDRLPQALPWLAPPSNS